MLGIKISAEDEQFMKKAAMWKNRIAAFVLGEQNRCKRK